MKKVVATMCAVLLLAACGEDEIEGGTKANKSSGVPGNFYEVTINDMPCIVWMDKRGEGNTNWAYSGLDCDWRER